MIEKIIEILLSFLNYTKEYILKIYSIIPFNSKIGSTIVLIALIYSIIKGGLLDNWKLILGAIVVAILLSII